MRDLKTRELVGVMAVVQIWKGKNGLLGSLQQRQRPAESQMMLLVHDGRLDSWMRVQKPPKTAQTLSDP